MLYKPMSQTSFKIVSHDARYAEENLSDGKDFRQQWGHMISVLLTFPKFIMPATSVGLLIEIRPLKSERHPSLSACKSFFRNIVPAQKPCSNITTPDS